MKQTLKLSLTALAAACALAACKQETSTPATSAASGSAANTAASAAAKDASALGTPEQQASYAMGIDIGRSFKKMKEQGTPSKTLCPAKKPASASNRPTKS